MLDNRNEIEKNLHAILSKDKDIATELIQMCEELSADHNISLSFQLKFQPPFRE